MNKNLTIKELHQIQYKISEIFARKIEKIESQLKNYKGVKITIKSININRVTCTAYPPLPAQINVDVAIESKSLWNEDK